MHKLSETKPRIRQLNLTALCTVCHSCITLGRSRVKTSTTSTPKPTILKFIFTLYNCSFKQAYLKISRVIRDTTYCDIRSCYSTTLLQLHVTWSKGVEDEHLSLLGRFAMWAGKLLRKFRPH